MVILLNRKVRWMKRYLILSVAPLILIVLVFVSVPWLFARLSSHSQEQTVQEMANYCVEHGNIASWSIESHFPGSHIQFTCLTKASGEPSELQKQQ